MTDSSFCWMLWIWYSVPGLFGVSANCRVSSVSSTHWPVWKPRLASGPSELTVTVEPEIAVIAVTTDPFSLDHLNVASASVRPAWISTR